MSEWSTEFGHHWFHVARVHDHWQPSNGLQVFHPGDWETEITTEGQGYFDELAADGKTAPNAVLTGSSTFRIKCGDDGFQHDLFDVQHHSCAGDLHRARTKVPRVPYTGDNFANMSSVLTKWFFGEMPNSRSCDGFFERLQTVLFTTGDPVLNAVYNANADVWHVPRELVMVRSRRALSRDSVVVRSLEDVGRWQVHAG